MDAAERKEILNRYRDHNRRFEAAAARRSSRRHGSVIPFTPPAAREIGQDPTAREIEVLQLVADGLVNREIGERLFLSEETVTRPAPAREASSAQQSPRRSGWLPAWAHCVATHIASIPFLHPGRSLGFAPERGMPTPAENRGCDGSTRLSYPSPGDSSIGN